MAARRISSSHHMLTQPGSLSPAICGPPAVSDQPGLYVRPARLPAPIRQSVAAVIERRRPSGGHEQLLLPDVDKATDEQLAARTEDGESQLPALRIAPAVYRDLPDERVRSPSVAPPAVEASHGTKGDTPAVEEGNDDAEEEVVYLALTRRRSIEPPTSSGAMRRSSIRRSSMVSPSRISARVRI